MSKDEHKARHGPSRAAYIFGFFPVVVVIILLAWSYRAYVFKMSLGYLYSQHPFQAILYAMIYHIFAILTVWSYWKILATPAGSPLDFVHLRISAEDMDRMESEERQQSHRPDVHPRRHAPVNGIEESQMLLVDDEDEDFEEESDLVAVESGHAKDSNYDETPLQTVTVKADGKRRYCKKCMCWKPDRAHHCKLCHRCILKMDHHCPWINTCVNWTNYKYFLVFITDAALLTTFVAVTTIPILLEYVQIDGHSTSIDFNSLEWAFLILVGAMFGIILIGFAAYHYSLLIRNMTTIESMERGNFWDDKLGGNTGVRAHASKKRVNVFDLGRLENIKQVMGPRWYLWLVPVKTWTGDGTEFPINTRFRD